MTIKHTFQRYNDCVQCFSRIRWKNQLSQEFEWKQYVNIIIGAHNALHRFCHRQFSFLHVSDRSYIYRWDSKKFRMCWIGSIPELRDFKLSIELCVRLWIVSPLITVFFSPLLLMSYFVKMESSEYCALNISEKVVSLISNSFRYEFSLQQNEL